MRLEHGKVRNIAKDGTLAECLVKTNCVLVTWEFTNLQEVYRKLIDIASSMPRTEILEQDGNYWHGVVRSLIFRFPDDLEILQLPRKGIIQVRSASRIGVSDLGVNRSRVDKLHSLLLARLDKD